MLLVVCAGMVELIIFFMMYHKVNKWFRGRYLLNASFLALCMVSLLVSEGVETLSTSFRKGIFFGGILALLLFGYMMYNKIKKSSYVATIEDVYKLSESYSKNPLCWDCNSPYRSNHVRVQGVVKSIQEEKIRKAECVTLYFAEIGENIVCYFESKNDMKSLCLGKRVSIIGKCSEDTERFVLEECFIDSGM